VSQNSDGPRPAARIAGRATRDLHRPACQAVHDPRTARTPTHMHHAAQHYAHQHTLMHTARHMQHTEQAAAHRRVQHRTARPSAARAAHASTPARGTARSEQRPASPTRAAVLFFPPSTITRARREFRTPTFFSSPSSLKKERKKGKREREKKKESRWLYIRYDMGGVSGECM
jgi:hypothetical protein